MERFVGKFAVVTGASSGIGMEVSKVLVKQGVNVIGLARRVEKLQHLSNEISSSEKKYQAEFYYYECDVQDVTSIKKAFHWIFEKFGAISILVNNAGVFKSVSYYSISEETFDTVFDTNVKGLVMCSMEALRNMEENGIAGHIINIESVTADEIFIHGELEHALYGASKHAVRGISTGLRREISARKRDIKVSSIRPGIVETEMVPKSANITGKKIISAVDVANACITVLDTQPSCVISVLNIEPIHNIY